MVNDLIELAGFAFLVAAAFWLSMPFGLFAAGVSLLAIANSGDSRRPKKTPDA